MLWNTLQGLLGQHQLGLGTLGMRFAVCAPWGPSNRAPHVSPLPRFPLEDFFFPLISFFIPYFFPSLLFPFCQHFLPVNESKKKFLGGAGIIWTFLGSARGWRCWQLCQSPADGFVMWALECPIWEGAGAKLTHSHIFQGCVPAHMFRLRRNLLKR